MLFSSKGFAGGIHPPDEKKATLNQPVAPLPFPKVAVVPLSQHTGKPARPIVKAGDSLKTGDLIGEADGLISANIHSPFTGTVLAVEPRPVISGFNVLSVVIEVKEPEVISEIIKPYNSLEKLSEAEILAAIKLGGIVGLGGAAFPTQVKLSPPADKKIEILLINAAECEPFLNVDYRLMLENPEAVIGGGRAVQKVLGVKEVVIGIEDNKPAAVKTLKPLISALPGWRLAVLRTRYPQGGEKQLIKSIFNREVPAGGLPMDIGIVVSNVATLAAIDQTLKTGRPLIERTVTVAGDAIKNPGNYLIRIGTPIKDVVEFCGGFKTDPVKIVAGGPMMGQAIGNLEAPVVKGTSGLLFFSKKLARKNTETACLRCGRCVDVCPLGLLPCNMSEAVEVRNFDKSRNLRVSDCIECGACAYVCPASRKLVQYIKVGKNEALKKK